MTSAPNSAPLTAHTRASWDRLIAAIHPPSMLVALRGLMGTRLAQLYERADIWQETLLMAWRDRDQLQWRGTAAFRRWMLEIARNRICDLADHANAEKRGSATPLSTFERTDDTRSGDGHYAGPVVTTSPGRAEADREAAARLHAALQAVPEELRDVVRLRLFEDLTLEEVAGQLGLGVEAVRYRFGRGFEAYHRELRRLRLVDSQELFP